MLSFVYKGEEITISTYHVDFDGDMVEFNFGPYTYQMPIADFEQATGIKVDKG